MIDKVIKVWFIGGASEDMSDLPKICEVATNHPHLLNVRDERKFVSINNSVASAERP